MDKLNRNRLYRDTLQDLTDNEYAQDMDFNDPDEWIVLWQNFSCEVEKAMGIYPNIRGLR